MAVVTHTFLDKTNSIIYVLSTRQIREAKKKFANAYFKMKQEILNRN